MTRVNIIIEFDGQQFEVNLSEDTAVQRLANGCLAILPLQRIWDQARDDAQTWVNARDRRA